MKRANVIIRIIVPMLILCALVSGCAVEQTIPAGPTEQYLTLDQVKLDNEICQKPDLPDWQVQRQKISEAVGDKVFDKEFGRVFDSLTTALATMGVRVTAMERQSGFISVQGALSVLPPDMVHALRYNGRVEWCRYSNVDPNLLPMKEKAFYGESVENSSSSMTISLVKQSAKQTKVKLRFAGVYYPPIVEELYKVVWPSLDKQIFIDKGTD